MKRNTIVLTSTVLILIIAALAWSGNVAGKITDLKLLSPAMISVKGYAESGPLWLDYTVTWNDGVVNDSVPVKVSGKFSETLTYQGRTKPLKEVTVRLWESKVSKSECAKKNGGKPCQHCITSGFHLEGRVDSKSVK
jgi:hypothetical protein